ncbi:MAG: 1-acyl-sn-glycerol-3-phosphate acyltransferase [Myxococcota bacterium]
MTGIESPGMHETVGGMQKRARDRLGDFSDQGLYAYIADAVYQERRRIEQGKAKDDGTPQYAALLERAAGSLRSDRAAMERTVTDLVGHYTREIHNLFSKRTYSFATRILPGALTRLLTASRPTQLLGADFDPASRIQVGGPIETLRKLAETHTLMMTPTHLSNLDSPLLGYALYNAGLPPCIYGAGLNLFTNPAMAFFMSRLGAYTVDRRKTHTLYKDVLKDYSIEAFRRGSHSLFFPGGTRSRSGRLEERLKKGLMGTAIVAWQEGLAAKAKNPEILVVPVTMSFALVLEAETLIEDALAAAGQSRYIITDDEFSEARTVASFARRVLNLDASIYITFGQPLDLIGNPVNERGISLGPDGKELDRRDYVTDKQGDVIWDDQRDRIYTARLARSITRTYKRDNTALPTHVVGLVAWEMLRQRFPRLDTFQLVSLTRAERILPRQAFAMNLARVINAIRQRAADGILREALPGDKSADAVLDDALFRFRGYHKRQALRAEGNQLIIGAKLSLYYGNRLRGYGLEEEISA